MKVNEIFGPTIQGEGKSVGRQVMFLRLAHCNLKCTWCDTKYTWDWKQYDKKEEVHEMTCGQIVHKLGNELRSLVVSGGEPFLQQNELICLLKELKKDNWWVEIETNGTITPKSEILELVSQVNCSPKLNNSGNQTRLRIKEQALVALAHSSKTTFKFVVKNKQDVLEVLELVRTFHMREVYLMPLGKTKSELEQTREFVRSLAGEQGFHFSDRLHVVLYGGIRGV